MYNVMSPNAEEFINDEEIKESLEYSNAHANDLDMIDAIIKKAKLKKGLSHREALMLLDCQDEKKNQEIFELAEQIKKDIYGNRIVMFAPLYL